MANLFGFQITRASKGQGEQPSFILPEPEDGATTTAGFYSEFLDLDASAKNEYDLIRRYRSAAEHPECDFAIEDIVNEAINMEFGRDTVSINTDKVPYTSKIKTRIRHEFAQLLRLLDFNNKAHDIFRRWYIDGRIHYHKVIDESDPKKGIRELRYIDGLKIKRIKKVEKDISKKGTPTVNVIEDYYQYSEKGMHQVSSGGGFKITKDSIAFAPSGLHDPTRAMVMSYLHKAIKPVNQLRMIEDSVVIYRISRAPERRIFYIDVGNLPKVKAEQYLKDVMNRYRNKLVYNATTGELRDERNQMSMLEDFWLPRREGGRGTEITTLPGGQNLGEVEDIIYFQRKLYRSLNIPVSRLEQESTFNMGRGAEITRDEVKFTKFIQKLRVKFNILFNDILKTQLILKGVIAEDDWPNIRDNITYNYLKDGHYAEQRDMDMLRDRLEILNTIEPYIGEWFSKEYVQKHVFRMSEEEIKDMQKSIDSEPEPPDIEPNDDGGGDDEDEPQGQPPQQEPPEDEGEAEEEQVQIDSKQR
tara:strand:+ start:2570 stop:4156 length:1587 start_codon:yes stop_codon:yes gene_type:complete